MGLPYNMHVIEHTYKCLLADVASHTGFSEIRGSYMGLQWCLIEAPKLEKQLMGSIESGSEPDLDMFPPGLRRLVAGSVFDPVKLRLLRQLLLFCYKASVTADNKLNEKAIESFLLTNRQVGQWQNSLSGSQPVLLDLARKFCQSVLYRFDQNRFQPSHGPGAVTTSKEAWQHWYETIEAVYPYSDFLCIQNMDAHQALGDLRWQDQIRCRLTAVPKDTRGPRLICVHPAEAVWVQQGVRRELERAIGEVRRHIGTWPRGRIRFDDQTVNGRIALKSSVTKKFATLDLKEASDRIPDMLVQYLFGTKYKYFGCCRAQKVEVANHGVFDLNCYAPMGNATTFPVESLVFWAICCASLQYHGFHQPGAVFVFGDDIIIPSQMTEIVIEDLESFGLVVNRSKTFWRSHFRESCGVDAFYGVNVSPIRWRGTIDADHISDLPALSDMAMRLRIAGFTEASSCAYAILRSRLEMKFKKALPLTNNIHHGGIAEFCTLDSLVWRDAYWHSSYHKFVSPILQLKTLSHTTDSCGWNHILESICSITRTGRSNIPDRDVSRRLRLDRGWTDIL